MVQYISVNDKPECIDRESEDIIHTSHKPSPYT